MSVVVGEGILKQFGSLVVLKDAAFRIEDGDRIGVVGPNGEGKTTLLRILAREEEPTLGTVEARRGLRVGYLPQNPPELGDTSLWEAMLEVFAPLRALERELHELSERIAAAHGAETEETSENNCGAGLRPAPYEQAGSLHHNKFFDAPIERDSRTGSRP